MSDTKHTPGPWRPVAIENKRISVISERNGLVCNLIYCKQENARLIAAAPELLEALELVKGGTKFDVDNDFTREITRRIDAAIAKAKGE